MNRSLKAFLAATTLVVGCAGLMWHAPGALAADEDVSLSTIAPNSPVSGIATTTLTTALPNAWVEVDFPVSNYAAVTPWAGLNRSNCATHNIVLSRNGSPILIDFCQTGFTFNGGSQQWQFLYVDSRSAGAAGDVLTLSWGSSFVSTTSSGASSVNVWNSSTNAIVLVSVAPEEPERSVVHHQAVALPASGACTDVVDTDFGWGTGLAGGWNPSWQQWVNDGQGGPVCQRSIAYVNRAWAVV
jgi:hypothetical protein